MSLCTSALAAGQRHPCPCLFAPVCEHLQWQISSSIDCAASCITRAEACSWHAVRGWSSALSDMAPLQDAGKRQVTAVMGVQTCRANVRPRPWQHLLPQNIVVQVRVVKALALPCAYLRSGRTLRLVIWFSAALACGVHVTMAMLAHRSRAAHPQGLHSHRSGQHIGTGIDKQALMSIQWALEHQHCIPKPRRRFH